MDVLKIIPQLFFDVIARVVPGFVALFMLSWLEPCAWASIFGTMSRMSGGKRDEWPTLSIVFGAYVIGHLISPGAKLVQKLTERYPASGKTFRTSWIALNSEPDAKKMLKPDPEHYDWLRVKSPEAGGLAAKLRAEFTMYNSLALIFVAFSVRTLVAHDCPSLGFALAAAGFLMAARGRETQDTMRKCVENFYSTANVPNGSSASGN